VISERSCDTEDWSNDAENSALITGKKNINNFNIFKLNGNNISQYYSFFFCIFDQK